MPGGNIKLSADRDIAKMVEVDPSKLGRLETEVVSNANWIMAALGYNVFSLSLSLYSSKGYSMPGLAG